MAFTDYRRVSFPALILPLFLGALCLQTLHADPVYGYVTVVQYGYGLPPDTAGDGGSYQQALDTAIPLQTSYTLFSTPTFNTEAKTSYTAIDLSNNTLYPVYADVGVRQLSGNFAQLHSWTIASTSVGDPNVNGSATVISTLIWIDHLSFVGAPVGTPVQYELTESLEGSLVAFGGYNKSSLVLADASVQGYGDVAIQESASQSLTLFNDTRTTIITSAIGQISEFEQQLEVGISGTRSFSIDANLRDTAGAYIRVLTPGVSLVSASEYDYAAPVESLPEPSCLTLVGCSLLGLTVSGFSKKIARLR